MALLSEYDLNCIGPIARSAEDLALALGVLAGPLPENAHAVSLRLPRPRARRLEAFRVAAWLDDPAARIDTEMRDLLEAATATLERAGAKVDRHARPEVDLAEAIETYVTLLSPIMSLTFPEEVARQMAQVGDQVPDDAPGLIPASARAYAVRHRDWLRAHERREAIRARWAAFFGDFDVLLCPVMLTPAFPLDDSEFAGRTLQVNGEMRPYLENIRWPGLITMALLPATVIPVGRTRAGLPVGVQIVGPYLEDGTPLAFARAAERALGGFVPPEGLA
jgi:amidase